MKKAKHTPGPWSDTDGNAITTTDGKTGICIIDDCPADDFWCDIERFPEEEECRANARLIAAAPELLAACQEVAKQANMNIDADDPDNWNVVEITRTAIEAVGIALAKAHGVLTPCPRKPPAGRARGGRRNRKGA